MTEEETNKVLYEFLKLLWERGLLKHYYDHIDISEYLDDND